MEKKVCLKSLMIIMFEVVIKEKNKNRVSLKVVLIQYLQNKGKIRLKINRI